MNELTKATKSALFMAAAYAALDSIYLTSNGGQRVGDRAIGKVEGRAEVIFDARIGCEAQEANITLTPNYETEVLTFNCEWKGLKMNVDLYLGDYGIDLVEDV